MRSLPSWALWCALALLLPGCAPRWTRPGANEEDFKATLTRCEAAGLEHLPPLLHWMPPSAGYFVRGYRNCWRSEGHTRCSYIPGRHFPPSHGRVDLNEQARHRFVRSCLVEDGWRPAD